jgi:predicted DNA-binding transcriptional regulator
MRLDSRGQHITRPQINIYEALALFGDDLKARGVIAKKYGVSQETASGVVVALLAEDLLEESAVKRGMFRITFKGKERIGVA